MHVSMPKYNAKTGGSQWEPPVYFGGCYDSDGPLSWG